MLELKHCIVKCGLSKDGLAHLFALGEATKSMCKDSQTFTNESYFYIHLFTLTCVGKHPCMQIPHDFTMTISLARKFVSPRSSSSICHPYLMEYNSSALSKEMKDCNINVKST